MFKIRKNPDLRNILVNHKNFLKSRFVCTPFYIFLFQTLERLSMRTQLQTQGRVTVSLFDKFRHQNSQLQLVPNHFMKVNIIPSCQLSAALKASWFLIKEELKTFCYQIHPCRFSFSFCRHLRKIKVCMAKGGAMFYFSLS